MGSPYRIIGDKDTALGFRFGLGRSVTALAFLDFINLTLMQNIKCPVVTKHLIFFYAACFCFAEEAVPSLAGVEELYWFNWNRSYPADVVFNHNVENLGFGLEKTVEFAGSSHDKITLNLYKKGE